MDVPKESDLPAILGGAPVFRAGPPGWPRSDAATEAVLDSMITSGDWGRYHGPHGAHLIQLLSDLHGTDQCLLCSSGTAAVELALRGVGVQSGDEVILAAYDFKANFQNVLALNAVPVLVDLDPHTCQMDPDALPAAVTDRTRAMLISHLHGGFVDVEQVIPLAAERRLAVVEDACQCPGATISGRRVGTWGDVGVLSFGGSKLLTAGRGGAVITRRPEIAERIRRHVHRGNDLSPLSEIQAALLAPQVAQLDAQNAVRRERVVRLAGLEGMNGLTPLQLPSADRSPAYYKVGFQYEGAAFAGLSREQFVAAARAEGIALDAGFRSNHRIHASRRFRAVGDLPVASRIDDEMVTLHHPILLEAEEAMDEIAKAIRRIARHAAAIRDGTS